jgi:hypothetical protein
MTGKKIKLLDTVALVDDLRERKLKRGEVGTVVGFWRLMFAK